MTLIKIITLSAEIQREPVDQRKLLHPLGDGIHHEELLGIPACCELGDTEAEDTLLYGALGLILEDVSIIICKECHLSGIILEEPELAGERPIVSPAREGQLSVSDLAVAVGDLVFR